MKLFVEKHQLRGYASFFQKMVWGPTTAANLKHVSEVTSQSCDTGDSRELKAALPVRELAESELWRLLDSLLRERGVLEKEERVIVLLASICST